MRHSHFAIVLAACATLASAPPPPPPQPIGQVEWGTRRSSGFLVGPCTLLTAKHAAPKGKAIVGARFAVRMGGQRVGATAGAVGSHPDPWRASVGRGGDWLLARLDRCIGARLGYFELAELPLGTRPPTPALTGFPADRREALTRPGCPALGRPADGTIRFGCSTVGGLSGGPIYLRRAGGKLVAIAIVSAGDPHVPYNLAAGVAGPAAALRGGTG